MNEIQNGPSSSSSPTPSTSSTLVPGSPTSNWHTIRPWLPPLTLIVREVTSVSVTFLLSSTITQPPDPDLVADLDELEQDEQSPPQPSIISEALAKGLSVKVNGSPWQRVFIRIDDTADEAVIIIYGLMPGRQYDIDLGIVRTRHLRSQVTTEEEGNSEHSSQSSPSIPAITPVMTNSTAATAAPTTSQNTTDTAASPPAPPPFTIEDRLAQLNQTLSLLNTERETLQAQIKTVKREGQKADAALRSEIEVLKRASEKHAAAEARAKQKILALQEASKRAQAGARTTDEQLTEIESHLPALLKEKEQREADYERVKKEAERVRKEREAADEKERKRLERLRMELSTMTHKLEKLNGKREKMEGSVLPDLQEQLKQTRKELESVEKEEEELAIEELVNVSGIGISSQEYPIPGFSRRRSNTGGTSANPNLIGRPLRTPEGSVSVPWGSPIPARPREPISLAQHENSQLQRKPTQSRQDSLRSSPGYTYPPGLGPFNQPDPLHSTTFTSSPSSSSSNSPTGPHPPGLQKNVVSPLSLRAPVFEPSRNTPYVAPIQRPSGATVMRSKSGASTQSRHKQP